MINSINLCSWCII